MASHNAPSEHVPEHRHCRAHRCRQDDDDRAHSLSTRARAIRSAKSTTAPPPWTSWSRSKSAASRSRRPRRPASGTTTASTSSTRPATSTSPSKSNAPCACSTARSPCSTPSPAWSRNRKPSGAKADKYHVPRICFVNKMDRTGADFHRCVDMMIDRLGTRPRGRCTCRSASEAGFKGMVDLVEDERGGLEGRSSWARSSTKSKSPPSTTKDKSRRAAFRAKLVEPPSKWTTRHGSLPGRQRAGCPSTICSA